MNDITQFLFKPDGSKVTHKVRTVLLSGVPWFVLADICAVLEIGNPSMAAARLDDDEKHTLSNVEGIAKPQVQSFTIVNESGLWSLVLTSRKPEAKAFKKWITSEVIPSLRKHGGYIVGQETMSDADIMARAVLVAQSRIAERDAVIAQQAVQLEEQAPKMVTYDTHVAGDSIMKLHLYVATLDGANQNRARAV